MKLQHVRFINTVKCGAKQDLYFTSDTHGLQVVDGFIVIDDHRDHIMHVPMSNVSWLCPTVEVIGERSSERPDGKTVTTSKTK